MKRNYFRKVRLRWGGVGVGCLFVVFLVFGCKAPIDQQNISVAVENEEPRSETVCVDVAGLVTGDPNPGALLELHRTNSTNYSVAMRAARSGIPVGEAIVNRSSEFEFKCLDYGQYALVMPAGSFGRSVGFPLPFEFDCQNYSLRISFQGGDTTYSVGAFEILLPQALNQSETENLGSLHRRCPTETSVGETFI